MNTNPQPPDPDDGSLVEDLVFACLEADDFATELERHCSTHPHLAAQLRRVARRIHSEGLVGDSELLATTDAPLAPGADRIPEQIGGYRLRDRLGEGGMGVVYLADDLNLGREVAVKLVRPEQLFFAGARERFQREVEAIARLKHPGIVGIHQVGEEQGMPFYAMDHVAGETLARRISSLRGRDPARLRRTDLLPHGAAEQDPSGSNSAGDAAGSWIAACLRILRQIAEALEHAHNQGVLHRDVKPSNIILDEQVRPRLLDFGLARLEDQNQELTRSSSQLGSLPYMPPEVVAGRADNPTASFDVYALGVTMFELLSLRSPFLDRSVELTRTRVLRGECPSLRELNTALSWEVEVVCATAMDANPQRRYADMAAFRQDLDNLLDRRPIQARPLGPWLCSWRWIQRHPTATVSLVATAALLVLAIWFATAQRSLALEARANSYVLGLIAADGQLKDHRSGDARRSLELCPEELQGFEWRHLNLRTDSSEQRYLGHRGEVTSVAVAPGGKQFYSGGADGTLRLWPIGGGQARTLLTLPKGDRILAPFGNRIRALVLDPIRMRLIIGCEDHKLRSCALDGSDLQELATMQGAITHLAISRDHRQLAAGTVAGDLRLLDGSGTQLAQLGLTRPETDPEPVRRPVGGLAFSPDGRHLFAGNLQLVFVFDTKSHQCLQRLDHGDDEWIFCVLPTPDGEHLLTAGSHGLLSRWHVASGRRVQVSEWGLLEAIETGVIVPESNQIYVAGAAGPIAVCDLSTLNRRALLLGHERSVMTLTRIPGSEDLLSASKDGSCRRWSLRRKPPTRIIGHHQARVGHLALSRDTREVYAASSDGTVMAWPLDGGSPRRLFSSESHKIHGFEAAPNGDQLAFLCRDLYVCQAQGGSSLRHLSTDLPKPTLLAWATDGRRLFIANSSGAIHAVSATSGQTLAQNPRASWPARLRILATVPWDGSVLAATGTGTLHRFDPASLNHRGLVCDVGQSIRAIEFDPRRRAVLVGNLKGEIRILSLDSGEPLQPSATWHGSVLNELHLDPSGTRLFSSSMSSAIQVWEYPSMRQLIPLRGHTRHVFALRSTPDGKRLVSSSWGGAVRIWESERQ